MTNRDKLVAMFYATKPKIVWRMSKRISQELRVLKSSDGHFILSFNDRLENETLFSHSIEFVEDDKLEQVYVFPDGTEKAFELDLFKGVVK